MPVRFVLVILLPLTAALARADEACDLSERLMQIEVLSHKAASATNVEVATRLINQMMAQIQSVPPSASHLISDELGRYELAAFLESRARMADIFRNEGLTAAQHRVTDPAYAVKSQGVRALGDLLECSVEPQNTNVAPTELSGSLTRISDDQPQSARRLTSAEGMAAQTVVDFKVTLKIFAAMAVALSILAVLLRRRPRRRRDLRYLCDIPTQIFAGGETLQARIIDISAHGAKLMVHHQFNKREPGTITLGRHGEISFRVAWTNENYAGIRFRDRLRFPLAAFVQETSVKHG